MDTKSFREFAIAGSFIVSMISNFPALATPTGLQERGRRHFPALATPTGLQELGRRDTAEDIFTFTCPPGTVSAQANVEDLPPLNLPARMRVMLLKDHCTAQKTDVNPSGSAGESRSDSVPTPSELVVLSRGPGLYFLFFFKTDIGGEMYRGSVICARAAGTPPSHPKLQMTQNQ